MENNRGCIEEFLKHSFNGRLFSFFYYIKKKTHLFLHCKNERFLYFYFL